MSHHTLVTFLGRGRHNQKTGTWEYLRTRYEFSPDDPPTEPTPLFGTALAAHIKPDLIVILGTRGSSWSVLLEDLKLLDETEDSLIDALLDAEIKQCIDEEMLNSISNLISRGLDNTRVIPHLIEFGEDKNQQYDILKVIAKTVPKGIVSLDLTHGFRHLGMIGFLSAFMLESVRGLEVKDLWYGALDMTPRDGAKEGITPVLTLDGLDRVRRWMGALERFDATGDYSVFVPLLQEDGVDPKTAQHLERAAFHERTHNLSPAAEEIRSFLPNLKCSLSGASELFRPQLSERLAWAKLSYSSEQRTKLADQYLERRDYTRAAMFGWEALVTRQCEVKGYPVDRYTSDRKDISRELKEKFWETENYAPYIYLKQIRDALTHGTKPASPNVESILESEQELEQALREAFKALLPR